MLLSKYMVTNIDKTLVSHQLHPFLIKFSSFNKAYSDLDRFLNLVFEHGGYVSGGFAMIVARAHSGTIDISEYTRQLARHINYFAHYNGDTKSFGDARVNFGKKDIDIFFPNEIDELTFIDVMKHKFAEQINLFEISEKGFAYNLVLSNVFKIQLIQSNKFTWNTIDEILSSFDILNCSVAFNKDSIILPSSWKDLEEKCTIHVSKWGAWTISRVMKYLRSGYKALSEETSSSLYTGIDKFSSFTSSKIKDDNDKEKFTKQINLLLKRIFGAVKSQLTDRQLIEFSLLMPSTTYDGAFQELEKRFVEKQICEKSQNSL
jgi:hypothetical protein